MLTRTCNNFVRSVIELGALNKINYQLLSDGNYSLRKIMPDNVRTVCLTTTLLTCQDEKPHDPCKQKDVYKVSPLCPPRGYEYKKKPVSLKCPPKKACPSAKKTEEKPKVVPPKAPPKKEEDCDKPLPKKRKEAKTKVSKKGAKKEEKKVEKKEEKKVEKKEEKPVIKVEPSKKEEPKKEPPKKDCPTKQEVECAKKELKGCTKPEAPPTCGKPPDDCSKLDLPKSVKPEEKTKRAKVRPGMELKCPPAKKEDIEKQCQKKQCCEKQPEVETCCSPRPWPFNLIDKLCNKPPKKKCPVKSKEDNKKKMISISENNLLFTTNRQSYSTLSQDNDSKQFHTSKRDQARPVCPPINLAKCSGGIELSKETEKLMVKLRAAARANRRRLPESCIEVKQPTPCFVPKDGWAKSHDFILMRDMDIIKKLPKKIYDTPRLVTRKLRKKQ